MDAGRMAVIGDPTGAMVGVWQAGSSIGATLVNDPGCLTMNELSTNDVERSREFYARVFGWSYESLDTGDGPPYWAIRHPGAARGLNGGMRELAPRQSEAGIPPHWMPYFTVESVDRAITTTTDAGGGVLAAAFDIPAGRIAALGDPQGAAFAIFEGEVDD
jgi:predicted enzyme related to lactoylglutathione lyase